MKNTKNIWIIFLILCIISVSYIISPLRYQRYDKRSEFLLGTIVEVTASDKRAFDIVFDEISRIENLLSKYKPESEIARLNSSGKLKVSAETKDIIQLAKNLFHESDGAFDITVSPAVDLWKESIETKSSPNKKRIAAARKLIGSEKIIINTQTSEIKFLKKGMKVDLGGIAKGYAVDSAVCKLREEGIKSCLINVGGDIYCLGKKGRRPWRIGIQDPREPDKFIKLLELNNKAVTTSGDYEQYFIIDNRRYSHIINPKTGSPVENNVCSVTVVAQDCMRADALATAIFVLGEKKGSEFAKRYRDIEVLILADEDLDVSDN